MLCTLNSGYKIVWEAITEVVMHSLLTFGAPLHLSMAESRLAPLHKDPRMLRTGAQRGRYLAMGGTLSAIGGTLSVPAALKAGT